ncbi:MAG: PA14 domain-containing protein, partial [Draconibacterium sp.]
ESLIYIEYFQNGSTPEYSDFSVEHQGRKRKQMQMTRLGDLVGLRYNIQSQNDDFEIYNVKNDPGQRHILNEEPGMDLIQNEMKAKVLQSRRPDSEARRPYDEELIPSVQPDRLVSGVEWSYFPGNFPWVPDVSELRPKEVGNSGVIDLNSIDKNSDGAICFEGYFTIPVDGEYTFSMVCGVKAFFRIHNCAVIDEDFGYQPGVSKSGKIMLKSGYHPFKITCLQASGTDPLLDLSWSGPGFEKQSLSPAVLFHTEKE